MCVVHVPDRRHAQPSPAQPSPAQPSPISRGHGCLVFWLPLPETDLDRDELAVVVELLQVLDERRRAGRLGPQPLPHFL